jgi:hypothetical protein
MAASALSFDLTTAFLNQPAAIAYGLVRGAGNLVLQQQLADKATLAFYVLGEGPWDSLVRLWINKKAVSLPSSEAHFHPGVDGEIGFGMGTSSTGGDQHVDAFWSSVPTLSPLTYSRYAWLALKVPPDPGAPDAALDVLADYQAMKCRIFDASGNQTSFQWTQNPAWWICDRIIRKFILREAKASQPLTSAELARIDWQSFSDAAAYFDEPLGSGVPRFSDGGVVWIDGTLTEDRVIEQLLLMCRSYILERNGKICLYADKPRASIFTFSADNVAPGTFLAKKANLRSGKNQIQASWREVSRASGSVDDATRFALAGDVFDHEAHQRAIGVRGPGLSLIPKALPLALDFGNNTAERVARLSLFQLARQLGDDVDANSGYNAPFEFEWTGFEDSLAVEPGDVVTLDKSLNEEFGATDCEILTVIEQPDGTRAFTALEYEPNAFIDVAPTQQPIEAPVPGAGLPSPLSLDGSSNLVVSLGKTKDDGTSGRFAVSSIDANRRAQIDFTQGGHLGKNLNNIDDTSTYMRTPAVVGDAIIENGNFEASPSILPPPGYQLYNFTPTLAYDTSTQFSGSQSIKITSPASGSGGIITTRRVMCRAGDTLFASVRAKVVSGSGSAAMTISFRDASGTSVGGNVVTTASTSWTLLQMTQTAPAGTVYATFELYASGASTTVEFDEHYARYVRILDNEVADGTTFRRTSATYVDASNRIVKLRRTLGAVDVDADDVSRHDEVTNHIGGLNVATVSLDSKVTDGTTYARTIASDLTGNRLDFSKPLLNKHLGNIPDDATSDRVAVSNTAKVGAGYAYNVITADNLYTVGAYHDSAAKQKVTTSRGGTTTSATYVTVASFSLVLPASATKYQGMLSVAKSGSGASDPNTKVAGTGADDSSSGGTVAWTGPGNITTAGNSVYATASLTDTDGSGQDVVTHFLKATNFGFAIPAGATIVGIEVKFERFALITNNAGLDDLAVRLLKAGVLTGTAKSGVPWSSTKSIDTYGSSSDLWGATLTPSDVNNANFGVVLSAELFATAVWTGVRFLASTVLAKVDSVTIVVHTSGGGTYEGRARLKIGSLLSNEIAMVDPQTYASGTAVISAPPTGTDITVEVQAEVVSGGITVDAEFSQVTYTDQAKEHFI